MDEAYMVVPSDIRHILPQPKIIKIASRIIYKFRLPWIVQLEGDAIKALIQYEDAILP